ncbi:MAG: outer membrane beta-barrel protein [Cocleimonas sp.]|nr:outer membrane beta-barrel protein [Cocleimonas sp.]
MKILPLPAISALVLSCFMTNLQANEINYDYVQVGYSYVNDLDVNGGLTASGSYDLYDNVNVLANAFFSTGSDSDTVDSAKAVTYTLGVGYHLTIADDTDLIGEVSMLNTHSQGTKNGVTVKQNGTGTVLSFGAKRQFSDKLELLARVDKRNGSDLSGTVFTLGVVYEYKKNLAFVGDFNTGADNGSESLTGSIRWALD